MTKQLNRNNYLLTLQKRKLDLRTSRGYRMEIQGSWDAESKSSEETVKEKTIGTSREVGLKRR